MSSPDPIASFRNRAGNILLDLLPTIIFLIIMIALIPFRFEFQYNSDEGVNLMKAVSVVNGYQLYDEIWSDQPPMLTWFLSLLIQLFGNKIAVMRGFILFFSCTLFWAQFQILKNQFNYQYAVFGGLLLLILPDYWYLSVSVMVGLPAIAMAVLSLYALLQWHTRRKYIWLLLSALMLGISISIKIFTGLLLPIVMIGLWINEFNQPIRPFKWVRVFTPALIWGGIVSLFISVVIYFGVGIENLDQLFGNHLTARGIESYDGYIFSFSSQIQSAIPFLALGAVGLLFVIQQQRWFLLYPAAWSLAAIILLQDHRPVWFHQIHLISVPSVMLSAPALGELWKYIRSNFRLTRQNSMMIIAGISFIFIWTSLNPPQLFNNLSFGNLNRSQPMRINTIQHRLLNEVSEYAPVTEWIIADKGIYAFYHQLKIPPEIAALTSKRIATGKITETMLIEIVQKYQPEQILLSRSKYPELIDYLDKDYCLYLDINHSYFYFLRNDILETCKYEFLLVKDADL